MQSQHESNITIFKALALVMSFHLQIDWLLTNLIARYARHEGIITFYFIFDFRFTQML